MKTVSRNFVVFSIKIAKNFRTILFVVPLVLFVLAAGAPSAIGTVGG
jgi:hypothetical protein